MPLNRPFPIDKAYPNAVDLRRQAGAIYPREGVFPDPVTTAPAGIAYANGGWNIGARPFVANLKRGGAPWANGYGSAHVGNDSAATVATTPAAPATGSRIDLFWVKAADPTQGEGLTTPSGETVARAVPTFGVTAGVAGTDPQAPALPAGVTEIARIKTDAGAASIAASVFTQTYKFANVIGGVVYFWTKTELDAAPGIDGEVAFVLATDTYYYRIGGAWTAGEIPGGVMGVSGTAVQGATRVWKTPEGVVHGYIDLIRNDGIPNNAPIAIVNAGFRPPGNYDFAGVMSEGGVAGPCFVRVASSGNIVVFNPPAGNIHLSFSFEWPVAV